MTLFLSLNIALMLHQTLPLYIHLLALNNKASNWIFHRRNVTRLLSQGAQNSPYDGTVKLFVDIDGIPAISIGEVKSGWDKWFYIISSFGMKCDKASHEIKIRVEQWVSEILGLSGRWQKIFEDTRMLKFDKASAKKKKDILAKFAENLNP